MRKPVKCWHTFSIIKQELCWNPILRNKVIQPFGGFDFDGIN